MGINNEDMEEYLTYCEKEKRLDAKTIRAYRCDLEQFAQWLISEQYVFNRDAVKAYLVHLNECYAPSSVKRKIASVKAYAFYCEMEKGCENNPFYGLRISIREPKRLPKTIPLADLNKMFDNVYGQPSSDSEYANFRIARNCAILEMLIATGIRVSELCNLDRHDCDLSGRAVRIMGKGAKERIVQLESDATIAAMNEYMAARERWAYVKAEEEHFQECKDALFLNRFGGRITEQSVRNMIATCAERSGASAHVTPHMFRHTFASLLLEENVDIRYIQHLLGHASIKTTEIYTHVAAAKQRDILKKNNPRNAIRDGR